MKRSIVRGEREREREDVRAWEAWAGWFEMREKVGREKQRRRERYGKRVSTNVKSCEGIYSGVLLSCFLAVAHGRDSLFWVLCKANMHVMPCASPNTPTPTPSQGLLPLLSVISSPLSPSLSLKHTRTIIDFPYHSNYFPYLMPSLVTMKKLWAVMRSTIPLFKTPQVQPQVIPYTKTSSTTSLPSLSSH